MQAEREDLDTHRVKLRVEAAPEEIQPILDLAYRHLAEQVNIPGFRKGKVPRRIIDSQVGREAVLRELLDHALPTFYVRALREHDLAPIDDPEFDDLEVEDPEGTGIRFSAIVEVRPRLDLQEADYRGLRIERPTAAVSDAEVDEQLDTLRDRFAELDSVGRPARRGDYVVIDLRSYVHDQEVPEVSGQDILYEVGSESYVPELDTELDGARRGDILKLNAKLPEAFGERGGEEVSISVIVKEVKAKRLPELDDDFAKTASEFDTLDELREDVRKRLGQLKEAQADAAIRDEALRALTEKVADVDLPERLVDRETESRVASARQRAEQQGVTLEDVLRASNVEELQFRADARAHATRAIRADLALEGVARAEEIQVTDEDLDKVVDALATQVGQSAKDVRKQLESSGQMNAVAGDIIRDKALELVVRHADVGGEGAETAQTERKP
jgi:trigger factor